MYDFIEVNALNVFIPPKSLCFSPVFPPRLLLFEGEAVVQSPKVDLVLIHFSHPSTKKRKKKMMTNYCEITANMRAIKLGFYQNYPPLERIRLGCETRVLSQARIG